MRERVQTDTENVLKVIVRQVATHFGGTGITIDNLVISTFKSFEMIVCWPTTAPQSYLPLPFLCYLYN